MTRDLGRCHLCGSPGADEVDHITPGDDHSLANLAPVHARVWPHCHRTKSGQEGARARKRYNKTRPREQHPGMVR